MRPKIMRMRGERMCTLHTVACYTIASQVAVEDGRPPKSEETARVLCPVDFVADRGGCNSDSPRVSGFGTASATPLIERSTAPSPSTAAELSPQICSWGLENTPAPGGPTPL